jgi:deazaflavin-dependent oxidoreductase (nitroreductase family)
MGLLTPLAVRIGSFSWMPKLLPQITWIDKQIQRLTRGRMGFVEIAGLPGVTLTVAGRKSGIPRSTPLLGVPYGDGWLIAGSYFGAPKLPVWANNLRAAPTATLRHRGVETTMTWRELEGAERDRAWAAMNEVWPNYDRYAERSDRVIPVFLLTPA